MIDNEKMVERLWALEVKYRELQDNYQLLIHQYEQLKEKYEDCTRYRDKPEA